MKISSHIIVYMLGCTALMGCSQAEMKDHANDFKRNTHEVGTWVRGALTFSEPAPPQSGIPQTRYCYKSFFDVT